MKGYTLKKLVKIFYLSLGLVAMGLFIQSSSAVAHGGGGGMSSGGMMGNTIMGGSYGLGNNMATYGYGTSTSITSGYGGYGPIGNYNNYNSMGGYNSYNMGVPMMAGYSTGYTGYAPAFNMATTSPAFTAAPNTAAMFGGWGQGYSGEPFGSPTAYTTMPYFGQNNNMFNNTGNTVDHDHGTNETTEPDRHDQGHMDIAHMDWGFNSPINLATIDTSAANSTSNFTIPYANAINSQGVIGFMSGLGSGAPSFNPRQGAVAPGSFAPYFGSTSSFTPYNWMNQGGYNYGGVYPNSYTWF